MDKKHLQQIKQRHRLATSGEWKAGPATEDGLRFIGPIYAAHDSIEITPNNLQFVQHAHRDMAALLAAEYDRLMPSAKPEVLAIKNPDFLRGVMYACAELVANGGSTVHAMEIANASGTWEEFRAVCDEYDLKRFAKKVGQQGIRDLRRDRETP